MKIMQGNDSPMLNFGSETWTKAEQE